MYTGRGHSPYDPLGPLWESGSWIPNEDSDFFVIMQDDGNLVIYRGTAPDNGHDPIWDIGKGGHPGEYFLKIQDDGNLVAAKGIGPNADRGLWWATDKYDSVVDFEITRIDYDLAAAHVVNDSQVDMHVEYLHNGTDSRQTPTISGSLIVTELRGWSNTLGIKVGVTTSFKVGVPIFAEGKIQVSAEFSTSYTWSGSTQVARNWGYSVPITLEPHTRGVVLVRSSIATLTVPYKLTGTVVYGSGLRVEDQRVDGDYVGTSSHRVDVEFLSMPE
jgi:hypothetical protein